MYFGVIFDKDNPRVRSFDDSDLIICNQVIPTDKELDQSKICYQIFHSNIGLKAHEIIHLLEKCPVPALTLLII